MATLMVREQRCTLLIGIESGPSVKLIQSLVYPISNRQVSVHRPSSPISCNPGLAARFGFPILLRRLASLQLRQRTSFFAVPYSLPTVIFQPASETRTTGSALICPREALRPLASSNQTYLNLSPPLSAAQRFRSSSLSPHRHYAGPCS